MLKLSNVTKKFGEKIAVDNLSFEIKEGEVFGLLGLNGAGKTTTFRMILNILEPNSGEISYMGKKITLDEADIIGFLPEERSLLPRYKVYDQLHYFGKLKSMSDDLIKERVDYWLKRFNCEEYRNSKIKELSKGNQQKIQFISSVMNDPKLLILDEPFSGLDPLNIELFKNAIADLSAKGTIIIFSSHRMDHVELFCERLAILVKGKTVINGNLQEIKEGFGLKNILINGDVDLEKLKSIEGVTEVKMYGKDVFVQIKDIEYKKNVFDYIKTCDNINKFQVDLPTLNEIFISKVGKAYDK